MGRGREALPLLFWVCFFGLGTIDLFNHEEREGSVASASALACDEEKSTKNKKYNRISGLNSTGFRVASATGEG